LSGCKPTKRAMNTNKVGWIGGSFILPDRMIGNTSEEIVLQSSSFEKNGFEQKGTLEEWQENLSKLCIGNSRMIFAISIAFASVLLPLVGEESAGFHFRCGSSRGKTTILRAAKSVWGNPAQLPKWRATGNGIEGLATKHNHCLLCLDELGQADPKHIGDSVYMLGNGEGKQRAGRSGAALERQSWNLLFLSTGEISLAATLAKVGQKTMAGQEVRFIDLPADAGEGLGAFDTVHDYGGGSQFAIAINESSYKYHGTAAQAFIEAIAEDKAKYSQIAEEHINDFLGELNIEGADPQVQRVARKIGLVYAGGMLATDFEITQWPYSDVLDACKTCFEAWLEERGGDVSHEETQILETIKSLLETEGDAKFKKFDGFDRTNSSCWGIKADGHFWVSTSAFKDALCRGFDTKKVIEVLTDEGYLVRGSDRPTVTKRSSGGSSRYYKIKETIVSYGFDDVDSSVEDASEEEIVDSIDVSSPCESSLGYSV
jgi:putative DNA primase/helicase